MCKFTTELLGSIDGGVHLSSEFPLRLFECADDIVQRQSVADDHDVYIAAHGLPAGRHGAINERNPNAATHSGEAVLQHLGDTESLPDKSAQLLEHWAVAVGLKVGLPAFHLACEDSASGELFQFPLDSARAQAKRPDDLPLIETPVGLAE